jgi:hypothetical protein
MKTYERVDAYIHVFLTLALEGGGRFVASLSRFNPAKEAPLFFGQKVG